MLFQINYPYKLYQKMQSDVNGVTTNSPLTKGSRYREKQEYSVKHFCPLALLLKDTF